MRIVLRINVDWVLHHGLRLTFRRDACSWMFTAFVEQDVKIGGQVTRNYTVVYTTCFLLAWI